MISEYDAVKEAYKIIKEQNEWLEKQNNFINVMVACNIFQFFCILFLIFY